MRWIVICERSEAEVWNYGTVQCNPHYSREHQRNRCCDGHRALRSARRHCTMGAARSTVATVGKGLAVTRVS
jgi:hypothetical protein